MNVFSNTLTLSVDDLSIDDMQISIEAEKKNNKQLIRLKENEENSLKDIISRKVELDDRSRWQKFGGSEKSNSVLQIEAAEQAAQRKITSLSQKLKFQTKIVMC